MKKLSSVLLVILLLSGCNSLQKKEQLLTTAGFRSVTPTTPVQLAHLKTLQAQTKGHLTPITMNGKTLFLLADAKQNRLLVGNQSQYQTYKQLRLKHQLAEDTLATKDLNADANAEWNAWGVLDIPLQNSNF